MVFAIAGDGSFQMTVQELAVAVIEKIPVKVAILNNGYLGMVRQWQQLFYDKRYSHTDLHRGVSPDFVKLARAYGAEAARVEKTKDVLPAIRRAIETDAPFVLDFIVEQEENVFPMVPQGQPSHDFGGRGDEEHLVDYDREQTRRAHQDRRALFPARVQYREPRRRTDPSQAGPNRRTSDSPPSTASL